MNNVQLVFRMHNVIMDYVNVNQIIFHFVVINVYHVCLFLISMIIAFHFICSDFFVCLKYLAAMAGDFCLNEQQCLMGNKHSKCKYIIPRIYGKCRCLEGFHQTKDNHCLPSKFNFFKKKTSNDDYLNQHNITIYIIRSTKFM